jgi:hypothetical protein
MKNTILLLLILCNGCSIWRYNKDATGAETIVNKAFLMKRESVSIDKRTNGTVILRVKGSTPDDEAIKAVAEGVTKGIIEGIKASGGVPPL